MNGKIKYIFAKEKDFPVRKQEAECQIYRATVLGKSIFSYNELKINDFMYTMDRHVRFFFYPPSVLSFVRPLGLQRKMHEAKRREKQNKCDYNM